MISLSDDGGFATLMGDLLSTRQIDLPIKVVVFNGALGFVEFERKSSGLRVTDPADPDAAMAEALAHPGPALVDAVIDRLGTGHAALGDDRNDQGFHPPHARGRDEWTRRRDHRIHAIQTC